MFRNLLFGGGDAELDFGLCGVGYGDDLLPLIAEFAANLSQVDPPWYIVWCRLFLKGDDAEYLSQVDNCTAAVTAG